MADVVTIVQHQFTGQQLLQLSGAVALPRGTLVQLGTGGYARVESLRLVAPQQDREPARLIVLVQDCARA